MKVKVVLTVEVKAREWAADQMSGESVNPLMVRNDVKNYVRTTVQQSGLAHEGYITGVEITQ